MISLTIALIGFAALTSIVGLIGFQVSLEPQTVSLLAGVLLPIAVAFVTREFASPRLKALALTILSTISGVLAQVVSSDGTAIISEDTLWNVAISWVIAVATYFGLWRPSGTTQSVQRKTRYFGFGGRR